MKRISNLRSQSGETKYSISTKIPLVSLRQALAVAEYRSFRHAASVLGITQSSVSARIKALEEGLGVLLFERNTRGVRLTEAGRRFVTEVEQAMQLLDRAVKTAGMMARGEEGELRIGVHALISGGFLDRLLELFHQRNPGVCLHITEGTARDTQVMVREAGLDLAFMAGECRAPDLHSRVLWRDALMAAFSDTHPLAAKTHIQWNDLFGETFIVREGGTGPQVHDLIVVRFAGEWQIPTIRQFNVGRDALLSMIAHGFGISLLARENEATVPPGVVFRSILDEPETIAFSAVWSPHNRNPALRTLLDLAGKLGRSRTDHRFAALQHAAFSDETETRPVCRR
jgi:DNA-binding transcriptional LysR family regulator